MENEKAITMRMLADVQVMFGELRESGKVYRVDQDTATALVKEGLAVVE